jgi:tRNA-specific 2-thiouridylase
VRVGPVEDLDVTALHATSPVWLAPAPPDALRCVVQVRAHGGLAAATVTVVDGGVDVVLDEPLRGVAPGQAAVFYRPEPAGDVVLGSATIASTAR